MNTYVILLRGINVGGKNKVPMAALKTYLEDVGFTNVLTYIASSNVVLQSAKHPDDIKKIIEEILPLKFKLDSKLIKALVLSQHQLQKIIDDKPAGDGVIYSQRLSAERTKSRLGKIIGTVPYQSMTIRSWNTTTKLLDLVRKINKA